MLSAADAALYAAKDKGRNRHEIFEERMGAKSRDALLIEEALQQAIANNEFQLVYQPIVEARSRRLAKVEALLRWRTPTLGAVTPDRFIPIAEDNGLIVDIGTWVMQEAARQAHVWSMRPEGPIRIAVNVSAAQLVDPDFIDVVDRAIAAAGATPSELEIEMTERVLINEAETVVRVIDTLHEKGLSTSLDDFGTGYSSLSYLTRFHLRTLKIDRAFVSGIDHDERSLALVRAIIAMGHSLGMTIVAEGVETETQANLLADLGCEYLQGYLFSPPVPADRLIAMTLPAA
ncbi:putative bifunctional diguanylate cyclase/phosphodiesterase [Niveibacterium sp.]|uniref:putative bifunctional diguanylate cyclase/phosphodiesterase n=1 Tax=Niveibacterium sp. TaxID=2017444 RepID=UPI0035AF97DC